MVNEQKSTLPKFWRTLVSEKPNVWRVISGKEALTDETVRSIRFSIQEVPKNRRNEVIGFMLKYFIEDEPSCKSLSINDKFM